jgi:hypothetical protein
VLAAAATGLRSERTAESARMQLRRLRWMREREREREGEGEEGVCGSVTGTWHKAMAAFLCALLLPCPVDRDSPCSALLALPCVPLPWPTPLRALPGLGWAGLGWAGPSSASRGGASAECCW